MRFLTKPIGRERRTHYQAGADFERKVRDHYMHELGATYVVRSAGSRGIVDLVVFFEAEDVETLDNAPCSHEESAVFHLVQCKRNAKLSEEDRELLTSLAAEVGGAPILAWPEQVGRRVGVVIERVSENPNAEATEITRG